MLVVDAGASMRCAMLGDNIAESGKRVVYVCVCVCVCYCWTHMRVCVRMHRCRRGGFAMLGDNIAESGNVCICMCVCVCVSLCVCYCLIYMRVCVCMHSFVYECMCHSSARGRCGGFDALFHI